MKRQPTKLLFVCSRNQWRSPTAEQCYGNDPRFQTRSRGTARSASQTLTAADIAWADLILVMEDKHRRRIRADFPGATDHKPLHVLDIPDDYQFMELDLVMMVRSATDPILEGYLDPDAT